jgi:hypothetical protein
VHFNTAINRPRACSSPPSSNNMRCQCSQLWPECEGDLVVFNAFDGVFQNELYGIKNNDVWVNCWVV